VKRVRTAPSNRIRVMVLDAHAGVRRAIATFVEATEDMELVGEAASRAEAMRLCASCRPDVALIGVTLLGPNGIQTIAAIRRRRPGIRVLAMGSFQDEELGQVAIDAGAVGYMLKNVSADELGVAIRAAYAAGPRLGIPATPAARG
jgi:NarL family two-component system response regulator LiaR